MHRVGFWFRVLAVLIDLAIFLPLIMVPCVLLRASKELTGVVLPCGWLLYSTFEVFSVGTPGKQLLGMEIANSDGSEANWWTRSLRWSSKQMSVYFGAIYNLTHYPLLYPLSGLAELIVGMGCLYASTEFREAWHDEWARTAVVRRPRVARYQALLAIPPPLPPFANQYGSGLRESSQANRPSSSPGDVEARDRNP